MDLAGEEVQRALRTRYVRGRLARVIADHLRRSDLLFEDPATGRFVVLSPETTSEGAELLVGRIRQAAGLMDLEVRSASASFPEHAIAFEQLLAQAEQRLAGITPRGARAPGPAPGGRRRPGARMTAETIRPLLWSGVGWLDGIRPEHALLNGPRLSRWPSGPWTCLVVLAAAPFWVPVMALIALFIKLDDPHGPVMFVQERTGQAGKTLRMHKFRTMVPNAEAMKWELRHLNELEWPDFKITNDPRITRPGKLLRKTSLDELPQLWDVLRGALSLVGPRPTDFMADTYRLWQTERLDVKPGITGLWQIYGRGLSEWDDRSRLDIAYVQRRCLWLDIQILFRTVPAVLAQRGAK